MRLNHQFFTTFQGLDLNLEELLGKYAAREYYFHQLTECEFLNYSISVPDHLITMSNCDGYDFIAYESNHFHDYSVAPLTVSISTQRLDDIFFQTGADQLAFLKRMVKLMKHQFSVKSMAETVLDGHPALMIEQAMSTTGTVTHAMLISNQVFTQITVSLRGNFTNAKEMTEDIITSFKVNSTPSPQSSFVEMMQHYQEVFESYDDCRLNGMVQYVISPTHTEQIHCDELTCVFSNQSDTHESVAFLGGDEMVDMMFSAWGNVSNHLAILMTKHQEIMEDIKTEEFE